MKNQSKTKMFLKATENGSFDFNFILLYYWHIGIHHWFHSLFQNMEFKISESPCQN